MKELLIRLLRGYAALAGYAVAVLMLITAILLSTGAINADRVNAAFDALRGRRPEGAVVGSHKASEDLPEREQILEQRSRELQKLEERISSRLSLMKAEQEALDRKRVEVDAAAAELKRTQSEGVAAKSDEEVAANVPILSRMEPAGIVAVLKDGDDARFVRHLRAMRPTKAAEVMEALRTDPQFEQEFRRVPADAPPGAKARMQRLHEEFQKTP
jgi:hypothetical protein